MQCTAVGMGNENGMANVKATFDTLLPSEFHTSSALNPYKMTGQMYEGFTDK